MQKSARTDRFWGAFRREVPQAPRTYRLIWFGGSDPDFVTELADLVERGPKRATTTLLRDFETGVEPRFPEAGDLWLVVDGNGNPRCVIRTTKVEIKPFGAVDAQFAWDEGEGDRTLADWRAGHSEYFGRQAADEGFAFDDTTPVVLERFDLIWPRRPANPSDVP